MINDLLASDLTWRFGWTLFHSLWQVAIVAVVAALFLALLRRQRANVRYVVACTALAAAYVPLVVTLFSPLTARPQQIVPVAHIMATVVDDLPADPLLVDESHSAATPLPTSAPSASLIQLVLEGVNDYLAWIVGGWLCGVGLLSLWNFGGWFAVERLRRQGAPSSSELNDRLSRLALRMRVTRPVRLLESCLVDGPAVLGWLRPVILVPPSLLMGMSPAELDAVLAHELAHIRRHDYLVNLLQALTETLLFYHPAVWWLSRRVRKEREFCCDDAASAVCEGRIIYAKALATVARGRAPALALTMKGKSENMLVYRVRRILSGSPSGRNNTRVAGAVLSLALLVTLVASLALASATAKTGDGDSAASSNEKKGTDTATKEKGSVKKTAREIFRPTTNKSGKTSWSSLFRPREQNKLFGEQKDGEKQRMMLVRAHRGDRWPVKLEGSEEALFHAELIDGNDKQVELKIIQDNEEKRLTLKLDQPEKLELAGKEFVFSYGTTTVEAAEPQYTDAAQIIITVPDKPAAESEATEDPDRATGVPEWYASGRKNDYAAAIDRTEKHSGEASARFTYKGKAQAEGFGGLEQAINMQPYRGKRLRISAFAKSKDVESYAALWARVDGLDQFGLAFENTGRRQPIKGSTDWTEYSVVLDVPQDALRMNFGILLAGKGQVWIDDVRFEIVGQDAKATGFDPRPGKYHEDNEENKKKRREYAAKLPTAPQNPGFEKS